MEEGTQTVPQVNSKSYNYGILYIVFLDCVHVSVGIDLYREIVK